MIKIYVKVSTSSIVSVINALTSEISGLGSRLRGLLE